MKIIHTYTNSSLYISKLYCNGGLHQKNRTNTILMASKLNRLFFFKRCDCIWRSWVTAEYEISNFCLLKTWLSNQQQQKSRELKAHGKTALNTNCVLVISTSDLLPNPPKPHDNNTYKHSRAIHQREHVGSFVLSFTLLLPPHTHLLRAGGVRRGGKCETYP
jgi:hypothetical protein